MKNWFRVFTHPKEVAKEIALLKPMYGIVWISGVYGLLTLLEGLQNFGMGASYPLWALLVCSLFFAVPVGYLSLSIAAALLWWTGKILKGKGSFSAIRSALAWSKIPEVVGLLGWIVLMVVYGIQVFIPEFIQQSYTLDHFTLPTGVIIFQIFFALWGFIVLLQMLAEVQGFSVWMALINVILKSALVTVIGAAFLWFFSGYSGG